METKTQHTPGPWKWDGHFCTGIKSFHSDGSERGILAQVGTDGGSYSKNEAKANARLIAASPDLLALLREWNSIGYLTKSEWKIWEGEFGGRVRAAIAKAEGKE